MGTSAELVRLAYELWNRDDFETARGYMHPEIEWHSSGLFPGLPAVCHGVEEVRGWWVALKEPWEHFTIETREVWEAGDRAVAAVHFEAVGKESGVSVELDFASTWEVEDGLIRRYRSVPSVDEARAALGL